MESHEEMVARRREERIRQGGNYHNAPGVSGMDIGFADVVGRSMYGREYWQLRKKREKRDQRVKSVFTYLVTAGCLVITVLLVVATVLGLIIVVNWLVSQL